MKRNTWIWLLPCLCLQALSPAGAQPAGPSPERDPAFLAQEDTWQELEASVMEEVEFASLASEGMASCQAMALLMDGATVTAGLVATQATLVRALEPRNSKYVELSRDYRALFAETVLVNRETQSALEALPEETVLLRQVVETSLPDLYMDTIEVYASYYMIGKSSARSVADELFVSMAVTAAAPWALMHEAQKAGAICLARSLGQ